MRVNTECRVCEGPLQGRQRAYCKRACAASAERRKYHQHGRRSSMAARTYDCTICDKRITDRRRKKYCDDECAKVAHNRKRAEYNQLDEIRGKREPGEPRPYPINPPEGHGRNVAQYLKCKGPLTSGKNSRNRTPCQWCGWWADAEIDRFGGTGAIAWRDANG